MNVPNVAKSLKTETRRQPCEGARIDCIIARVTIDDHSSGAWNIEMQQLLHARAALMAIIHQDLEQFLWTRREVLCMVAQEQWQDTRRCTALCMVYLIEHTNMAAVVCMAGVHQVSQTHDAS
jgi:hypothetical protein